MHIVVLKDLVAVISSTHGEVTEKNGEANVLCMCLKLNNVLK